MGKQRVSLYYQHKKDLLLFQTTNDSTNGSTNGSTILYSLYIMYVQENRPSERSEL